MAIRTEGWLLTFRVISKSCLSPTFPIMPVLNLCSRQCRYPSANPRNPLHDVLVTASKREADVAARALPKILARHHRDMRFVQQCVSEALRASNAHTCRRRLAEMG